MRILFRRPNGEVVEVVCDRFRLVCGKDRFELREEGEGLSVRLEEHDEKLGTDLAVFPVTGNGVRLTGGAR